LIPGLTGSLGARTTIWKATGELVGGRPLFGYGPETLGQVFTLVYPPELVYVQGRAVRIDRAHNLLLDTLASTGVAGLLAYAVLVGAAVAAGVRAFVLATCSHVRLALAGALAAVTGHLVEIQFSFPVTATATIFWLLLGVLVAPWSHEPEPAIAAPTLKRRTGWPRMLLAALLIVTLVPAVVPRLAADLYAGNSNWTGSLAELQEGIAAAEKAARLWPDQTVYHQHLSWLYLQAALLGDDPPLRFRAAEAELDRARRLTPDDYRVWAGYGELYLEWAQAGQPERFAQAEAAYRQATALFPSSAMLHTGWGLVYLAQDRLPEAEEQFHQAVGLDHTDHWAFWHLGNALLAQGDLQGAEAAYLQARRWAPDMLGAHLGLGHVYSRSGLPSAALRAFQHALSLAPEDPGLHLDVARTYWDLDQRALACETVSRGLLIEPSHEELLTFRTRCIEP
jgi:tetratricopeptide (TPR) repeat protein